MMKTRIYSLLVALMSVVVFNACDDWTPSDQGIYPENTGGVSCFNMKVAVNESDASISRADIDTSGYLVTITDKVTGAIASYDGKSCSWSFGQMPSIFTLPVGQYIVTVRSHEPEKATWSTPYYVGTAEFEVKNNKVTYIGTVTCNFAAVKVEIKYSDDLVNKLDPSWTVTVNAGKKGNELTWNSTETRFGYFILEENNPTITATFSGKAKNGKETITEIKTVSDARGGNYYIFTFSVAPTTSYLPDEKGQIAQDPDPETTGISIDYEVIESLVVSTITPGFDPVEGIDDPKEQHPDKEEWPETPNTPVDPENPDDPNTPDDPKDEVITIVPEGINLDGITPISDGKNYKLTFKSTEPFTNIEVKIDSPYLTPDELSAVGLTSEFDLANPGDLKEGLSGLGFPTENQVIGQTSIEFDLTQFIPLLADDDPDHIKDIHIFHLTLKAGKNAVKTQDIKFQQMD